MNARLSPRGLGRGLSALIADVEETKPGPQARMIPIERLHPGKYQPRHRFDDAALDALAESLKQQGVLQPLLVRPHPSKKNEFEIVAGERRWRAAQRAGLHDVPIAIVDATDVQSLEFAIIENVQRADLNPIEEAAGYVALMEQCNHTQDQVAQIVGKSRPYVANMVRLLKLPDPVKNLVRQGKLSAGHARVLIGHGNPMALAELAIGEDFSVRQLEEWVRQPEGQPGDVYLEKMRKKSGGGTSAPAKDADTRALERRLTDALGLEVSIDHRGEKGTLSVKYTDLDQLDAVVRKLGG